VGSIITRQRSDGTKSFRAQVRVMRQGEAVHSETQTFDRKAAANAWIKKRETELSAPGALDLLRAPDPILSEVIDKYIKESRRDFGKTKKQVLRTISRLPIGSMKCSEIGSPEILQFVKSLEGQPQTAGNYMSHLAAVFAIARPAWGYRLDKSAIDDARVVAKRLGLTARSNERDRRPTLEELDKLLNHFAVIRHKRTDSIDMQSIVLFAIFSTRRLDEITRITFEDLDMTRSEIMVRDMKHPGEKVGNDVRVRLPSEALAIACKSPSRQGRLFPFNSDSVSASFTRACKFLGIEDLHFHDLRHDGISRLFELGWTIPQASTVSGHRTWASLKRYTHIRQTGDKYAGWQWLPKVEGFVEGNPSGQESQHAL
jgi:integrase